MNTLITIAKSKQLNFSSVISSRGEQELYKILQAQAVL